MSDLLLRSDDRILVVAPHPDDETLGCGGLIATARRRALAVRVVFATDGGGSHRSPSVSQRQLRMIRRREALLALLILGVRQACVTWMGMKDRFVPARGPRMDGAALRAARIIRKFRPTLLVVPSLDDRHGDHRATANIWQRAIPRAGLPLRRVDYEVWPPQGGRRHPAAKLDISAVGLLKRRATRAHRSQLGLVVRDDPQGFVLSPGLLARAQRPFEYYQVVPE